MPHQDPLCSTKHRWGSGVSSFTHPNVRYPPLVCTVSRNCCCGVPRQACTALNGCKLERCWHRVRLGERGPRVVAWQRSCRVDVADWNCSGCREYTDPPPARVTVCCVGATAAVHRDPTAVLRHRDFSGRYPRHLRTCTFCHCAAAAVAAAAGVGGENSFIKPNKLPISVH